ncbi:DUF6702 family protein [Flavobacterium sp.]|uniref:DUF6702 family protein n=1 Tax=Flavobacterium sp. TaxID=239 RepID=UPI003B98FCEC
MKKCFVLFLLMATAVASAERPAHKFYVSLYKVIHNAKAAQFEITGRIFIDDLNEALTSFAKRKTYLGDNKHTPADELALESYLQKKFTFSINGKQQSLEYLKFEREDNTIIVYLRVKFKGKISRIELSNPCITEVYDEQQNIIQLEWNGTKKSVILTSSEPTFTYPSI